MSEKQNQNPENCNHNCDSCGSNCASRNGQASFHLEPKDKTVIRHMIGVVSGKGGVGKSFVTSLLASEMARRGYRAAVIDGDITGPSQAKSFGIHDKLMGDGTYAYPAVTKNGIQVVSTNMMLDNDETPVIWRAAIVTNLLKQFYTEVLWDNVDYMFVDMPPGTGDVPLTAFQSYPLAGIIVVTTPQDLVGMVVEKAINMAEQMHINVLGLVENMAYVECPNCHEKIYPFGKGNTKEVGARHNLPVLSQISLDPRIAQAADAGTIEDLIVDGIAPVADACEKI